MAIMIYHRRTLVSPAGYDRYSIPFCHGLSGTYSIVSKTQRQPACKQLKVGRARDVTPARRFYDAEIFFSNLEPLRKTTAQLRAVRIVIWYKSYKISGDSSRYCMYASRSGPFIAMRGRVPSFQVARIEGRYSRL